MRPARKDAAAGGRAAGDEAALAPGLHLVATPIGHSADITLRALDVLSRAQCLAAEDTRRTRQLMEIHGIGLAGRPMVSYHDRNGPARRPQILGWLAEGKSVAYCSDAGTPLVADPGYRLVEACVADGHPVTAVPGPSAALVALTLSGLPSDRFLFAGFLPAKAGARQRALGDLANVPATLIFFESARRLGGTLSEMADRLGDRPAAVARELTKRFEEVTRGRLIELAGRYGGAPPPKGEVSVIVGPPEVPVEASADVDGILTEHLSRLSVKEAAARVAERLGRPRREIYARALALSGRTREEDKS